MNIFIIHMCVSLNISIVGMLQHVFDEFCIMRLNKFIYFDVV